MRKLILGMSAMALVASAAAFAGDEDNTRVAATDSPAAAFTKLDADADGRISAIEAANNSKVAAGFTTADADKDGYLSKAEYAQMAKMSSGAASPRSSSPTPEPSLPSDSSETAPAPK
jgi:thymidine phosphorylase